MNRQPYAIPPRRWEPMLTPSIVRVTRKYRRRLLWRRQGIREVQVTGGHHLRDALDRGVGVMITPNHAAHYDSAALYLAADQLSTPLHFMTAWQVFAMSPPWEARLMQRLGCFSIDRESSDRAAFKQGVGILQQGRSPLVVFPEGDIYHITDRVTPFREGAAAIALSAARRSDREIAVVPCGIKFRYLEDPTRQLEKLMSQLEERLFMRPRIDLSLKERIFRFAESLLALKEIEYLGTTQSGLLVDRISCLSESILNEMGSRYAVRNGDRAVPDRVKELRQRIIVLLDEFKSNNPTVTSPAFLQLSRDMDALFFVLQLYSYPGDYLSGSPSVERVAETIDKFEEDVLQQDIPSVHARRRVEVRFGEPIVVPKQADRGAAGHLTKQTHAAVQALIDQLCGKHSYREQSTQSVS